MESFIGRNEAAEFLGISTRTLDRYVRRKILKSHRRGRRTMFLRLDVESLTETPTPKSQVISGDQETLPEKPNPDITALSNLAKEMHHELQKKEGEISRLHFELGKYQEIAKNSLPLLEAKSNDEKSEKKMQYLKKEVRLARLGRFLFFALFALSLGAIGILANYIMSIA